MRCCSCEAMRGEAREKKKYYWVTLMQSDAFARHPIPICCNSTTAAIESILACMHALALPPIHAQKSLFLKYYFSDLNGYIGSAQWSCWLGVHLKIIVSTAPLHWKTDVLHVLEKCTLMWRALAMCKSPLNANSFVYNAALHVYTCMPKWSHKTCIITFSYIIK